ncbi:MAG: DUF72 domain-containing protein, partial [Ferruginibacter sp.]|nr:DUF72 domain-containing protein [Cytophagales bacterium]
TQAFCLSVAGLGERLGVAFLQLPPSFGPANGPILANYLRQFPASIPLAVEFRHPDWFNQPAVWHQTLAMLRDHGVSTVITDVAGRRDALHQSLTTPTAFIRYVGNMPRPTDYSRLDAWVQRLKSWLESGLERLYFFVHEFDNIISPEVCRYLIRELNRHCGLQMAEPRLLAQVVQGTLF